MEENQPSQIDPIPPPVSENAGEPLYAVEDRAATPHLPISPPGWLASGIPMARAATIPVPAPSTWFARHHVFARLRAFGEITLVVPVALLGAVLGYLLALSAHPADERWLTIADGSGLGLGAATGCIVLVWLGRSRLSSIGLTTRKLVQNIALGLASLIGFYFVLLTGTFAAFLLYPDLIHESTTAQEAITEHIPRMTFLQIVLFCSCVAFYEEVVFRGFLLTRLHTIFRRWWLAVPVAVMAFGLPHGYEGPLAVVVVTLLGLTMSILFIWRKSLVPAITMHFVHNTLVFAYLTYLAPKLGSPSTLPS
jgi:membrane protease YdiL (CAAX protease family)